MFWKYAALVKNLRGVVLLSPSEEGVGEGVRWLTERFRYRNVGVPPSVVSKAPEFFEKRLGGKPFVELAYPVEELKRFADFVSKALSVSVDVAEAVVLASAYVSPILVIGRSLAEEVGKLAIHSVWSNTQLDASGWRLHLRIADYTVLDFYSKSVEESTSLWEERFDPSAFVDKRAKAAQRDEKRYWRLKRGEEEPWLFMLYVDLASCLAKAMDRNPSVAEELRRFSPDTCSAALCMESAVLVPLQRATS